MNKILLSFTIFAYVIAISSFFYLKSVKEKQASVVASKIKINAPSPLPSSVPTPEPIRQQNPQQPQINAQDWSVNKKDETTTTSNFPPDNRMATAAELNAEVNQYRSSHGIGAIATHPTLCSIAQIRANQLLENGGLDNHAGFGPIVQQQNDFQSMTEVIGGGKQPNIAVHIVEWGWGRSLTGHKEAVLDSKHSHGCGGVAGYYVTFVFGNN